jgi:tetratricopeptide (TPR) repeat protein
MNAGAAILVLVGAWTCGAETPERLYEQALRNFSEQRFGDAGDLLRDAVSQRPKWFEARFLLGATLVSLGRPDEAIEQLQAAHRLNPSHLDCGKLLAAEYLGLDRAANAIGVLRPFLAKPKPDEEVLLLGIEAMHVRNDAGDADEALRLGTVGLKRFPRSARMLAWHGFALRERGKLSEARRSLEAALALSPDDLASKGVLGDVLLREGRLEEAIRLFEQILQRAPMDEEALIGRARTLAAMGKTAEALDAMRAAVRASPDVARLRLEISQLYAKAGDRENAAREAEEFRRLRGSERDRPIPASLRTGSSVHR